MTAFVARTYVRHGQDQFLVSTINRESSAVLAYGMTYAETIVWRWDAEKNERGLAIWQGEGGTDCIATHLAAVRRLHATGSAEVPEDA